MNAIYIALPIKFIIVMSVVYLAMKNYPVATTYALLPCCFYITVWCIIRAIKEIRGKITNNIINFLTVTYLVYVFYGMLQGINRVLAGQNIIAGTGEVASYTTMLLWSLAGVAGGFILFFILRAVDRWEDRKSMRAKAFNHHGPGRSERPMYDSVESWHRNQACLTRNPINKA